MSASLLKAARTSKGVATTVTCPTCDYTVIQGEGNIRTICPNCGHFYSPEAAERREPRRRPQENNNKGEKKPGGRIQSITNFFSRITPGGRNDTQFSALPSDPSPGHSQADNSSSNHSTELPPIKTGSLTVQTNLRATTPSYAQNQRPVSQNCLSEYNDRTNRVSSNYSVRSDVGQARKANSPLRKPFAVNMEENLTNGNKGNVKTFVANSEESLTNRNKVKVQKPIFINSEENLTSGNKVKVQKPFVVHSEENLINGNKDGEVQDPIQTKTSDQLRQDIRKARETGDWKWVQDFYAKTFDSFVDVNTTFKRNPSKEYKTIEDPGLKFDLIDTVYDLLLGLPQDIQKTVLKSIINCLLKDKRPHSKDALRAYLVILQNPQFGSSSTYVIFAHLLRQIAALADHDHHYMVYWLRKLRVDRFQTILERLQSFISIRLFPTKPHDLPPMEKSGWWIPSATKVLALLNAANNLASPPLTSYTEFYNNTLDNLDLMKEYNQWQNPNSYGGFSFCQYPFILSIAAKRRILQEDSEQQMILMARRSLVAKVQRHQLPDAGMLFLNLTVRRNHLVSDSLTEISRKQHDLKKKLKVTFAGEPGLDMGGLTKEWFLLLIRQIFRPNYGMFSYCRIPGVYWFINAPDDNYQEFNLVGVLMGLAVYNSIILDIRFPAFCYKKLLSPAVVPFNNPQATVGTTHLTLEDLKQVQPDVAKGLQDLLDYDGNVEEDFGITFQISTSEFETVKTHDLKPNGANIPVTNENRKEYVDRYVNWILNESIYPHFQAFYHGFHTVCASNALIMLRPEEVEMLVCGCPKLDMAELKKITVYDGYHPQDPIIRHFWDVVLNMPTELQKKLLMFTTGSDRIPITGMSDLNFKITRAEGSELLPTSHTCFNQLVLPSYKSKRILRHKLLTAIQNTEGFGLE
ncbi:hypothetical protein CHS0354_041290 [Potamilus streckersoni]|uniref:HECT-type E3 ubiquitin transferase n=1 Tax=Potamilus streckersoni TaxID=2493646 RepID=A0AAE0SDX5_9BIVA|nr:hypothetical protein CHS0354_041290 [Potamilus streckersoni]